jgi:hypothetical protein
LHVTLDLGDMEDMKIWNWSNLVNNMIELSKMSN